ncbi:MAG TPA: glycosyl hydrolase family 57 [Planctomycetota bacterium]|nr:glycosyl hydrolase family 57 [Planctomycetota bacterium]
MSMPEIVNGLPNICGNDAQVEEVTRRQRPVYLHETNLRLDKLQSCFAIALHMQQPLIPAGGGDIKTADMISNLDHMFRNQGTGDNHNASVFADCYGRIGDIVPELVSQGRNPRVMLDYSGELFYGLRKMGRGDVLERLRRVTCDPHLRKYVEWLGTMWGHAVASSTPLPDLKLHMRAWQHNFAAVYGWDALERVRGFSPPEMHMPNHPDACFEYVKALRECGYNWLLVQEHTVEDMNGHGLREKHLPYRMVARNSCGEEVSIIALIKTQGSDTKLVAQMQPFFEAQTLQRREIGGISVPPIVTQIGDGENGGVMMNEFPQCYRQTTARFGTEGVVSVNGTEYLEMLEQAGVTLSMLPSLRPIHQGKVFERIKKWEPGAADKAIADIKKENSNFCMDGGSWTNNISWTNGYENVLEPMNKLSAQFHEKLDSRNVDTNSHEYRNALFHLLVSQTSCFRYWGQGVWTDYAREISRRGSDILTYDFK